MTTKFTEKRDLVLVLFGKFVHSKICAHQVLLPNIHRVDRNKYFAIYFKIKAMI